MSHNNASWRRPRLSNDPGNSGLNRNAGNERPGTMPLRTEVDSSNSDCFQLPPEECPAKVPSATFSGRTPHIVEYGSSHFEPTPDCPRERYQEAMLDAQEAYLAEMSNASLSGWMPPVDEYGSTCFERKPDCPREQEENTAEERYKGLSGLTHYSDYPGGLHLERIEDNPREQNPEYMLMELYLSNVVAKEPYVADVTGDESSSSGGPVHKDLPRPPANNSNLGQEGDSSRQTCHICQRSNFRDNHNYREHMDTHTGGNKIWCPEKDCGKSTQRERDMIRHHMEQHSGQERFQCPQCPKSYLREHTLTIHKKRDNH